MSVHERIGAIFLAHSSQDERMAFSSGLQQRFLVRDGGVGHDELRIVLLLESPHKEEVCRPDVNDRFPLAGRAGEHVRERMDEWKPTLALSDRSIGQLVHDQSLRGLGIMNVSQIPLQGETFRSVSNQGDQDFRNVPSWENCLKCMKAIRDRPRVNYRGLVCKSCSRGGYLKDEMHQLRAAIEEDLKGRLETLRERSPDALLVCCGHVAQTLYERVRIDEQETCNFPHPMCYPPSGESLGGWHLAEPAAVQRFKQAMEGLVTVG